MATTEATHTPGPWTIAANTGGEEHCIIRSKANDYCVAEVHQLIGLNAGQSVGNALLISAAPELLAICREIANDPLVDLVASERRSRLYAAIAKATGN